MLKNQTVPSHAGNFTEDIDPTQVPSMGYGPTGPIDVKGLTDAEEEQVESLALEAEQAAEPSPATPEAAPSDTDADAVPSPSSEEDTQKESQVSDETAALQQKAQMLDWIMRNPDQFAALQNKQPEQAKEVKDSLEDILKDPKLTKPYDEMDDKEIFKTAVSGEVRGILRSVLPGLFKDMKNLNTFKGRVEEILMKTATTDDGTRMHPRWDELQGAMQELSQKHPTLDVQECYALADKIYPSQQQVAEKPRSSSKPVRPTPRKPSKAANNAAKLSSLGRSSQNLKEAAPMDIRQAAERALDEMGIVE